MIDQEIVKQIQQASVTERIQLIELILESLKHDMTTQPANKKPSFKRFKARQFNLGREVHMDRDLIYDNSSESFRCSTGRDIER